MYKSLGITLLLILMLSACSNEEPAIVKVDTPVDKTSEEPELVEEITDDEEIDEFIEFPLEDEVVRVNLNQVPILKAYLQAASDREPVIEDMEIQRLLTQEGNNIYLLKFSCQNNQCSYLLLDQNTENSGFLVSDLATFENAIPSPDGSMLLLRFNRETSEEEQPLSDVVIIDLKNLESLPLSNEEGITNLLDFQWPILSADWIDDETISISVPDTIHQATDQEDGEDTASTNNVLFQVIKKD